MSSDEWYSEVRPRGIEKYGEEQWADWEELIEYMTRVTGWQHPRTWRHMSWSITFDGLSYAYFDMQEVDWTILKCIRLPSTLPPRFTKYAVLML